MELQCPSITLQSTRRFFSDLNSAPQVIQRSIHILQKRLETAQEKLRNIAQQKQDLLKRLCEMQNISSHLDHAIESDQWKTKIDVDDLRKRLSKLEEARRQSIIDFGIFSDRSEALKVERREQAASLDAHEKRVLGLQHAVRVKQLKLSVQVREFF